MNCPYRPTPGPPYSTLHQYHASKRTNNDKEGGEEGHCDGDAAQRQRQLQTQVAKEDADTSPHGEPNQGLLLLQAVICVSQESAAMDDENQINGTSCFSCRQQPSGRLVLVLSA